MFKDRKDAGLLLAEEITKFLKVSNQLDSNQIVVLALPRGGVAVALEVALTIGCPLDVIVSKKIGAPQQSELAIGAVTSDGVVLVDHSVQNYLHITDRYVESQVKNLVSQTNQMEQTLRKSAGFDEPVNLDKKCVIVIDDGVATGMTAIAALRSLRTRNIGQLVFATPVVSANTSAVISRECDQLIALEIPLDFNSVGQFYSDFHQVENWEVIDALKLARGKYQNTAQSFAN